MILNKFKKLSIKNKIILSFLFNSLVIFLIIFFVIMPRVRFIKEKGDEILEKRRFLEEQYIKAKNFRETNEDMNLVDEDIDKLDEVFVDYNEDLEFVETLERVADENNVEQEISLDSKKEGEESEFEKIRLEISAEGSFFNVLNYLVSLETLDYYINISSLDINKTSKQKDVRGEDQIDSLDKVFCKIVADTYWK